MDDKKLVDDIIKQAAKKANITDEQSRKNIAYALEQFQKHTLHKGSMDLTSLGPIVYTKPICDS